MTTRPIRTTRTMPPNSPRITPGSRDLLNHTPIPPPPNMYRITPFIINPTITLLMVLLPLTPFPIQHHPSGMVRHGPHSVSLSLHRRPFKRHPCHPILADQSLRPYLHLRLHQHQHQHPRPSAYMLLPPSHSPTRRRGEPQGHLKPLIRPPNNPSASRGRRRSPFLGMPHRWRRQLR